MTILDWIRIGFDTAVLLFMAYVAWRFYMEWREHADLPIGRRILTSCFHSATIVWTKVCVVVATIITFIQSIAELIGGPEARAFLDQWIPNPKILAAVVLVITGITYWARLRSLRPAIAQGLISG